MDSTMVEETRPVSHYAAAGRGHRARPRGFGRRGASCSDDHRPPRLGDRLSVDFRIGNRRGHDADHGGHRAAFRLFVAAFRATQSRPGDGFWTRERRFRIISVLPDWLCRRIIYWPPELGSEVGQAYSLSLFIFILGRTKHDRL